MVDPEEERPAAEEELASPSTAKYRAKRARESGEGSSTDPVEPEPSPIGLPPHPLAGHSSLYPGGLYSGDDDDEYTMDDALLWKHLRD